SGGGAHDSTSSAGGTESSAPRSTMEAARAKPAALAPRFALAGCLLVALALAVHGLVRALSNRVPLRYILGPRWWAIAIALAIAVAVCAAAAARAIACLRSTLAERRRAVAEG